MYVWGKKSLRSALNNFFISESKKVLQKMIEACQKKKNNKNPQVPAWRASHWPNRGQFEHDNNYNKNYNLLNKIGIHEY